MQQATITRPPYRPMASPVHLRTSLFLVPVLLLAGLGGAAYWYLHRGQQPITAQTTGMDAAGWPSWLKQPVAYPPDKPPEPPAAPPPGPDLGAQRDAALLRKLQEMQAELDALKKKPAPPAGAKAPEKLKQKYAPMLFVTQVPNAPPAAGTVEPTYLLAPGDTKIPCTVETAMSSEVEGYMTAKVRVNVYDSKTRSHVLIPQNSTILGQDKSSQLLYGNSRIPTLSLTLALPDGSSVELGEAPIVDQQGISGLTGDVNNHWWRLVGAVFVQGALRGGAQATQTALAGGGPVGSIGSSIAQTGAGLGQTHIGRSLDTRPTITVAAGELCTIILIKPLQLKAFPL